MIFARAERLGNGVVGCRLPAIMTDPDVLVIGGGPSGCATALAFAQRGARVLQLEAHAEITQRLAGEWLHPSAVDVLRRLGIVRPAAASRHPAGRGFVVFPDDGEAPITLTYSNGDEGWTCPHLDLVTTLRAAATSHLSIDFRAGTRVTAIEGQRVTVGWESMPGSVSVRADLIVGADGRASVTRRFLGLADDRVLVSYMAGLLLEDAELPFEGFGHVFLGGPGPVFACRIGPHQIRVCLDVPCALRRSLQNSDTLWDAYRPALPRRLHVAFRRALDTGETAWVANQWHPRAQFGRNGLALVGDAVGHFHPLTAVGLALGLGDGYCLAQSKNVADYRRRRSADSYVAEVLSSVLYQLFTLNDAGTQAFKQAVFETWRRSPSERRLAMRLLAGDETNPSQFHHAILRALTLAFRRTVRQQALTGRWRATAATMRGFGSWLHWLALLNMPRPNTHPRPASLSR